MIKLGKQPGVRPVVPLDQGRHINRHQLPDF